MSGEAEGGLCTGKKGSVWVTIRVHVILTFVAMTCLGGAAGQAAHKSPKSIPVRDHKALQQRENDLRDAANKLLQVFRTGDTATFLTLVHPLCKALVTFGWTDPVDNIHASGLGYVYEGGQRKVTGFDLAPARPPSSNTHRSDSL
jgi:hypothetical protein